MKTRFWNQLPIVADELMHPWPHVTPDPDSEDGGGTLDSTDAPPAKDASDEPLGENGKKALVNTRRERDELNRQLAEANAQIEQMKGFYPPDKYRELLEQQEEARKKSRERELELQKQKSETEEQFQTRLIEAQQQRDNERKAREEAENRVEQERQQRFAFAKRTMLSSAFYANGGRDGQDEEGTTYFDLFMNARGDARTKYDPETGQTYVVDKDGNSVNGDDNKPLSLAAWMNQLADNNPIIGGLFEPRGGAGGGGLQGTRGVKATQVPDVAAERSKRISTLLGEVDWTATKT